MKHFAFLPAGLVCAAALVLPVAVGAQPPADAVMTARLDAVIANAPPLKNAIVGVLVRSLDSGKTLYEKNADTALMPASNEKIITSTTALYRLGLDFRYKTTVLRTGTLSPNGVLRGDLYLRGTGDPSLTSARLQTLADACAKAGIRRVTGRVIADATRFDNQTLGDGWTWDNEPFGYQAQISALNCDENVLSFSVRPGETAGAAAQVIGAGVNSVLLDLDAIGGQLINTAATTTAVADPKTEPVKITFDRVRGRNHFQIGGTIARNAAPVTDDVTVENPAQFTVFRFANALLLDGLTFDPPVLLGSGVTPTDAVLVAEDTSPPLRELVKHFLKASDNLYGEVLLKTVGAEKGKGGSASEGERVVMEFLREVGIDNAGLQIADGSGLSRLNHVTPRLLVALLTFADTKFPSDTKAVFYDALPIGGVDGTLRNRFKKTPADKVVHAKTGTLNGVSALSGYLTTKAGERLVFSILMNNYSGGSGAASARNAQDALVLALMDAPKL